MYFCERQKKTGSSGQGGQETIDGHTTGRDQRYEIRAAQGVGGDVNYCRPVYVRAGRHRKLQAQRMQRQRIQVWAEDGK